MSQLLDLKPLFAHQQAGTEFVLKRNGIGALFMECGTGKTRTALEIFSRLKVSQPYLKLIVISPLSLLNTAWRDDISDFTDFSYHNAHDEGLPDNLTADIMSINFEMLLQPKNKVITRLLCENMVVIDESSKLKDHSTQTTKLILSYAKYPRYRIVMSGTPAPNSPLEYWAQIEFLFPGYLSSFSKFRNEFFHLSRNGQDVFSNGVGNPQFISQMINSRRLTPAEGNLLLNGVITRSISQKLFMSGAKYAISDVNLARLMRTIAPFIFWAKKADCLDLPEQLNETREVIMTLDQKRHYKQLENDLITEIRGAFITARIALEKRMKLREVTSGFAFDQNKNEVEIGNSPKLKELDALLDELGNQQVIIWGNFKWEIRKICELLNNKYGENSCVTLYSDTKNHDESISLFKSGAARYLVANPQSAAHGLNLQNCSTEIFFSLNYSYEQYEQASNRTHRSGQKNKCTYIHLVAKDSIDEEIMEVLKKKGDMDELGYRLMVKAGAA